MQSCAFQSFGPLEVDELQSRLGGIISVSMLKRLEIATYGGSKGRCHLASAGLVFHVISLGLLCLIIIKYNVIGIMKLV